MNIRLPAGLPVLIREKLKILKKNWMFSVASIAVLISLFISFGLLAFFRNTLPPNVPLWFGRPWGVDQLTKPLWLIMLPVSALLVYIINTIISIFLLTQYRIFIQIIFTASAIISFLTALTVVKIIMLVI